MNNLSMPDWLIFLGGMSVGIVLFCVGMFYFPPEPKYETYCWDGEITVHTISEAGGGFPDNYWNPDNHIDNVVLFAGTSTFITNYGHFNVFYIQNLLRDGLRRREGH